MFAGDRTIRDHLAQNGWRIIADRTMPGIQVRGERPNASSQVTHEIRSIFSSMDVCLDSSLYGASLTPVHV
jgi:hypothetical protein